MINRVDKCPFVLTPPFPRANNALYILEITLDFETNTQAIRVRTTTKFTPLLQDLFSSYNKSMFLSLSMVLLVLCALQVIPFLLTHRSAFLTKISQRRIIVKTINISNRTTYYIFYERNKPWNNPELLIF